LRLKCTKVAFHGNPELYLSGVFVTRERKVGKAKGGEEKVKGRKEEEWRERFGPPKNFWRGPATDHRRLHCVMTRRHHNSSWPR